MGGCLIMSRVCRACSGNRCSGMCLSGGLHAPGRDLPMGRYLPMGHAIRYKMATLGCQWLKHSICADRPQMLLLLLLLLLLRRYVLLLWDRPHWPVALWLVIVLWWPLTMHNLAMISWWQWLLLLLLLDGGSGWDGMGRLLGPVGCCEILLPPWPCIIFSASLIPFRSNLFAGQFLWQSQHVRGATAAFILTYECNVNEDQAPDTAEGRIRGS